MSSSSQKAKNNLTRTPNSSRIASLRSKLKESSQLAEQLDSIVESYNESIEANVKTIASLQSSIKNMLSNLKQAHSNPAEWLATGQPGRSKEKQGGLLLQSKMYQFNEIYHAIATNSILIDTLTLIKANRQAQVSLKDLPVATSKREFLAFYNEVSQYYRWRHSMAKNRNAGSMEEILKAFPELSCSMQFQAQMEEKAKRDELLSKINLRFGEIQEKLLGFALQNTKINSFEEIQTKLQKLQAYVKQSYQDKDNHKITPKNVKEHNDILHLMTLLSSSNVGLLQETIERHSNQQLRSICGKLLQNILKNNKTTEFVYDFLIENISDKSAFKFSRSVKQLPLERKLIECQRLIKQVKLNPTIVKKIELESKFNPLQSINLQQQSIIKELNNKILESDKQLLLAEEQIYTLQTQNKSLQRQKQQLANEIQKMQQIFHNFQSQKQNLLENLLKNQDNYQNSKNRNKLLAHQLQGMKLNHNQMQKKILAKQVQIVSFVQKIITLTNKLNDITSQKQQIISIIKQKAQKSTFQVKIYDIRIDPYIQPKNMQEVITFIEEIPLNMNNNHISKTPSTPPKHKSQKFPIKHSRSLSNVDFLSQLMPEILEKDLQNDNLSGTIDSQQLKKGIQLRQKTIKKYEIYMEKQRKEAKRHRSEILQLQSKIRALELEQIKLKQMIDDQSSENYLQFEDQGCSSMINIQDCTQKTEEIKSIEKIAEKEVELKVKQEELNFKIEEIIKHVLKLNTLKVSSQNIAESEQDFIVEEFMDDTQINPESKITQQTQ